MFHSSGSFSVLQVVFVLQRHTGYFLIQVTFVVFYLYKYLFPGQVYLPCTLIVVLSWVGFWLNREATSDRVGLGKISFTAFLCLVSFLYIMMFVWAWAIIRIFLDGCLNYQESLQSSRSLPLPWTAGRGCRKCITPPHWTGSLSAASCTAWAHC